MELSRETVLAVIPARGGSKGIPRKNLQRVGGRSLVHHAIASARESVHCGRIAVSTDDPEITEVALSLGAEVIHRPPELSTDEARTESALLHVLSKLERRGGYVPEIVVTLQPTSPTRTGRLIDRCIETLVSEEAEAVVTVAECHAPIWSRRGDVVRPINRSGRRQDRDPFYLETGAVYVTRRDVLLRTELVLGDDPHIVITGADDAVDINDPLDLVVADAILALRQRASAESRE
jgi:N-acylneuraminate cytidylyltransferase